MARKGLLIALEGGEGVGKSSQAIRLFNRIELEYPSSTMRLTAEPSPLVRELVTQEVIHDLTRLYLIAAGRAETYWTIHLPVLEAGGIVITDRHLMSTVVYQANYHPAAFNAHHYATEGRHPDASIVLDMPIERSMDRLVGERDVLEREPDSVQAERRARFLWWAEQMVGGRCVNADGTREEVHTRIWDVVQPLIEEGIRNGDVT